MSTVPYTPAKFELKSFNCPHCGTYAKQNWWYMVKIDRVFPNGISHNIYSRDYVNQFRCAQCDSCNNHTIWLGDKMMYPTSGTAPLPNPDMPHDVKQDYEEARSIVTLSPRGAAALLRLSIQKLCKHLGASGENINSDIATLVANGLPVKLQQALDSVRVVGNNAVHPGQIDLTDDVDTANKLFVFINIICDNQISQPKQINEFYTEKIPDNLKDAIDKRDGR